MFCFICFCFSKVYIVDLVLFVMKFWRGVGVLFVGLLLFILLLLLKNNFIGNVVWEPVVNGNCTDFEILTLWDDVFIEDSSGVVILKDFIVPEGDCGEYLAYKNNSDGELWIFYEDFYASSWGSSGDLYFSEKKILNSTWVYVLYSNVSSVFLENFTKQTNISLAMDMILNINDGLVNNWSVLDEESVKNKFNDVYGFIDVSGLSFENDSLVFSFNENDGSDLSSSYINITLRKNKALFDVGALRYNYDPDFFVEFLGNIGNFVFLVNSSWNFAFDFMDYFNISNNVSVEFDYIGINNTSGSKINYSFNGSGVYFMPAIGFNGSREFRLVAKSGISDVVSNNFIVNITRDNVAPVLNKDVPYFYIKEGEDNGIDLDYYFYDIDPLTYGVSGVYGVDVSFNGSIMRVGVNNNFSDYSKFKVYAFDGFVRTFSDYIYVFLEEDSVQNESSTSNDIGEIVETQNISGIVRLSSNENKWGVWIIIFLGFLVVVDGVGFFVYFFVLRNKKIVPQGVGSSANNYVRNLELGKK